MSNVGEDIQGSNAGAHVWECNLENTWVSSNNDDTKYILCSRNSSSRRISDSCSENCNNVHQEKAQKMFTVVLWQAVNYLNRNYSVGNYSDIYQQGNMQSEFYSYNGTLHKNEWTTAIHTNTNICHRHNFKPQRQVEKNLTLALFHLHKIKNHAKLFTLFKERIICGKTEKKGMISNSEEWSPLCGSKLDMIRKRPTSIATLFFRYGIFSD